VRYGTTPSQVKNALGKFGSHDLDFGNHLPRKAMLVVLCGSNDGWLFTSSGCRLRRQIFVTHCNPSGQIHIC
jgi:hypothetical protein